MKELISIVFIIFSGVGPRNGPSEEAAAFAVRSGATASTQTLKKFGSRPHGRRRL